MDRDLTSILGMIALVRILAWLTPGANMLAVLSASVSHGRITGLMTGLGIAFGGFLWAVLSLAGVSVLLAAFPMLALSLRLAGAAYLVHMGLHSIMRTTLPGSGTGDMRKKMGKLQAFRSGLMVTGTNPKASLFYTSIFTTVVPPNATSADLAIIAVFSGLIGVVTYSLTAFVFSIGPVTALFRLAMRPVCIVLGLLFCGLGASIAWQSLHPFLPAPFN